MKIKVYYTKYIHGDERETISKNAVITEDDTMFPLVDIMVKYPCVTTLSLSKHDSHDLVTYDNRGIVIQSPVDVGEIRGFVIDAVKRIENLSDISWIIKLVMQTSERDVMTLMIRKDDALEIYRTDIIEARATTQYTEWVHPSNDMYPLLLLFGKYCHIQTMLFNKKGSFDSVYYGVYDEQDDEVLDNTPDHDNDDIIRDVDKALAHIKYKWKLYLFHCDGGGDPFLVITKSKNKNRRVLESLFK